MAIDPEYSLVVDRRQGPSLSHRSDWLCAYRAYGVAELTEQQAETFQFLIVLMLTNA